MLGCASGCSSAVGDLGPETGVAADTVTADWIHPACTADALQPPTSPADACNGPWTFGYVESWTDRNACGEDPALPCESYNSCTSWDRDTAGDGLGGVQSGVSSPTTSGSFQYSCKTTGNHTCTLPGQSRPTSAGAPTYAGDTRAFAANAAPTCQTCDQLPADTDSAVQAKLECFDSGRIAATGNLKASLTARMKLLFQLAGERLTAAQRTRVEALYDSDPDSSTACSVPVALGEACGLEADTIGTQLQLCANIAQNNLASLGIATAELPHCLDQLTNSSMLSESCRLLTRDLADNATQGMLGKTYPVLSGDLSTQLVGVLGRINQWSNAATAAAAGDRSWLLGHANTALRQLWSRIELAKNPLPVASAVTSDAQAAVLLADVANTGFANDTALLAALFAPGQTGQTPPLLTLTGDALQPFADRLGRLEPLHDVGCRFASCRTVTPTSTTLRTSEVTELIHALSVLADHDALAAALASASHLSAGPVIARRPASEGSPGCLPGSSG